jgi:O-antigen/teichoic acid export membrane protein
MFPLWGAMALTAGPMVALLLGPVWAGCAVATLPLIGLAAWMSLGFPAGVAAVARGATGYTLAGNLGATALTLAGAVLLRPDTPLGAALIWVAAQAAVAPYTILMTARALRLPPFRPLRAGLRSAALAMLATVVAGLAASLPGAPSSAPAQIVLRLAVFAAMFAPAAAFLLRADLREAWRTAGLRPSPASLRPAPSPAQREREGPVAKATGG